MSFLDTCIQDSLPIWRSCLETPFLRRMADGTLDEECFKGYIVDDSLYLREYSKVFAWGMIHSNDMEEIRNYYSLLAFVNEAEDSTRRYYLKRYGLLDEEIQPLPLRPENRAYVDYMLNAAKNADDAVDYDFNTIKRMLAAEIAADPGKVDAALDVLMVIKYLERIGDHAVNIAEWVEFLRTGRYHHEKMF